MLSWFASQPSVDTCCVQEVQDTCKLQASMQGSAPVAAEKALKGKENLSADSSSVKVSLLCSGVPCLMCLLCTSL